MYLSEANEMKTALQRSLAVDCHLDLGLPAGDEFEEFIARCGNSAGRFVISYLQCSGRDSSILCGVEFIRFFILCIPLIFNDHRPKSFREPLPSHSTTVNTLPTGHELTPA